METFPAGESSILEVYTARLREILQFVCVNVCALAEDDDADATTRDENGNNIDIVSCIDKWKFLRSHAFTSLLSPQASAQLFSPLQRSAAARWISPSNTRLKESLFSFYPRLPAGGSPLCLRIRFNLMRRRGLRVARGRDFTQRWDGGSFYCLCVILAAIAVPRPPSCLALFLSLFPSVGLTRRHKKKSLSWSARQPFREPIQSPCWKVKGWALPLSLLLPTAATPKGGSSERAISE